MRTLAERRTIQHFKLKEAAMSNPIEDLREQQSKENLNVAFQSLEATAIRVKRERDALLEAAKAQSNFLGELNDCRYCGVIFTSRYGVDYKTEHAPDCAWRKLKAAIALAEQE